MLELASGLCNRFQDATSACRSVLYNRLAGRPARGTADLLSKQTLSSNAAHFNGNWCVGVSCCLYAYEGMLLQRTRAASTAAQRKDVCSVGAQESKAPDPVVVF